MLRSLFLFSFILLLAGTVSAQQQGCIDVWGYHGDSDIGVEGALFGRIPRRGAITRSTRFGPTWVSEVLGPPNWDYADGPPQEDLEYWEYLGSYVGWAFSPENFGTYEVQGFHSVDDIEWGEWDLGVTKVDATLSGPDMPWGEETAFYQWMPPYYDSAFKITLVPHGSWYGTTSESGGAAFDQCYSLAHLTGQRTNWNATSIDLDGDTHFYDVVGPGLDLDYVDTYSVAIVGGEDHGGVRVGRWHHELLDGQPGWSIPQLHKQLLARWLAPDGNTGRRARH